MAIVINGSGTVTGLAVGGLPDGTVDEGTLATDSVTAAKIPASLEKTFVSGRKNFIINGGFDVWQRGTTDSYSGTASYRSADRVYSNPSGGSMKFYQGVFDQDQTDVSGNPTYYGRLDVQTGADNCGIHFKLEDHKIAANRNVTLSFWAKSATARVLDVVLQSQGSTTSVTPTAQTFTATSSWVRYSFTFNLGSISAVAGTKYTRIMISQGSSTSTSAWLLDIANVQLEVGSTATDFEQRSYGEELALCRRYYQAHQIINHTPFCVDWGAGDRNTNMRGTFHFDVEMRAAPTQGFTGSCGWYEVNNDTNAPQALHFSKNIMAGYNDQGVNIFGDSTDDTITFSAEL